MKEFIQGLSKIHTIAPPLGYCVQRYGTCEEERCYCQVDEEEYYKNEQELVNNIKIITQHND